MKVLPCNHVIESYIRNHIEDMDRWELFQIFLDDSYSESFLREVWDFVSSIGVLESFRKLSFDFIREHDKEIFWSDLFNNKEYTAKEKQILHKMKKRI